MLSNLARSVGERPFAVISLILILTIIFSLFIPSMKSGTNMEDFLPDNKIVRASKRISNYFGGENEVFMIYVKTDRNPLSTEGVREIEALSKYLEKLKNISSSFSIATMINSVSFMEYHASIENLTDPQLEDLISDIFNNKKSDKIITDPNRDSKSRYTDIESIRYCYDEYNLSFFIKVNNLGDLKKRLCRPVEWSIEFENLFIPSEKMRVSYRLSARLEPETRWFFGDGLIRNLKHQFRDKSIYNKSVYLWIKPPGKNFYFPIKLIKSKFFLDYKNSTIVLVANREEIGRFGIAPRFGDMELPAKLHHIRAESRVYGLLGTRIPWLGFGIRGEKLSKYLDYLEKIRFLSKLTERASHLSIEDIDNMISSMGNDTVLSFEDVDRNWIVQDLSPDDGFSSSEILIRSPFMDDVAQSIDSLLSKDRKSTLVILEVNGYRDRDQLKQIGKEIENLVSRESNAMKLHIEVTGSGIISYQIDQLTGKSNRYIMPGIFIAIMAILFFNFRRPSYVILPLIGLSISIVWLFGTMSLLGMKFNTIAVALVPLIMGLGVDYSVHLFHNYMAELSRGEPPLNAIRSSILNVGTAMFLATLTTCISFLSFLTSSVSPLRDFGILCAMGIVYTFIITITLQASVRYILDKNKDIKMIKRGKTSIRDIMGKISTTTLEKWKYVIIAVVFATLIFSYGAVHIKTSFSMEEFLPRDTPAIKTLDIISDEFPSASQNQEYILIEGKVCSLKTLYGIYETELNMEDDKSIARYPDGSLKIESVISIMESAARSNRSIVSKFNLDERYIPKTDKDLRNFLDYLYNRNPQIKRVLHRGKDYDATLIRVYLKSEKLDSEFIKNVYMELNNDLVEYGSAKATVTGEASLIYTITKSLTDSQIKSTIMCMLIAGIVLIAVYRKISLGIIAMVPVLVSSLWIIGSMYYLGYSLNVMTVMITSLTIGLGITYAIHAVERFRLTLKKRKNNINLAIKESFSHTGGAILAAAITTIAGFAILILSPLPPEQQFGIITALTIIYALVTTVLLLPPLLMLWAKSTQKS